MSLQFLTVHPNTTVHTEFPSCCSDLSTGPQNSTGELALKLDYTQLDHTKSSAGVGHVTHSIMYLNLRYSHIDASMVHKYKILVKDMVVERCIRVIAPC